MSNLLHKIQIFRVSLRSVSHLLTQKCSNFTDFFLFLVKNEVLLMDCTKQYRNTLTHWAFDSKSFHFLLAFLEFSVFTIFVWGLFSLFLLILKRVSGAETRALFFKFWAHAFCFQPIRNQLQARKKNNLSRTKFKVSLKKDWIFCMNYGGYFGFEKSPQT